MWSAGACLGAGKVPEYIVVPPTELAGTSIHPIAARSPDGQTLADLGTQRLDLLVAHVIARQCPADSGGTLGGAP